MRLQLTLILGIACASYAAGARFQSQAKPQNPAGPATPLSTEKERIEREIQGVWEVTECLNPRINPILRSSGFMMVQDGWLSINVVVTTKDKQTSQWIYNFVGSTKHYTISELNRLRLVDVWGFSNPKGDLQPDVSGVAEERNIQFVGPPEIGQKLTITRSSNESMTFVRRALPPKPPVIAPADTAK